MLQVWQKNLTPPYPSLGDSELIARIESAKKKLGKRLLILGHHYQQDDVIRFADFTGDSFELARQAARQSEVEYVIFCGVHFMAESADILTDESVAVILPDLGAGCSMADMANLDQTFECWEQLQSACAGQTIVSVTYMNSSAAIKAFVGEHGGAVCTSSNCRGVLEWALGGGASGRNGTKVLFFPDQHLGRNTAYSMGIPLEKMALWNPALDWGGNSPAQLADARIILWKGHCSVHQLFRPEHVDQARAKYPGIKVIVHPECRWEVVQKADLVGSTAHIVKQIEAAPAGSQWAVGTEVHLIQRLAHQFPQQRIIVLSDCQCLCTTMYRIDLPHLCWAIENLVEGKIVNRIQVDAATRKWATVALERMLAIAATPQQASQIPTPAHTATLD
ncbi:MAG: quinolinate synthase NadA [Tepidisphaeraceae bacterium]